MNYISISPHFPENFQNFIFRLHEKGVRVLGIADEPYENLKPELKAALTEYYRVDDMNDYDQMVRACGYFTHRYGKIDRIESHNEHWLELDAALRTDFNVPGLKREDMSRVKYKSEMKKVFEKIGIPVAKGRLFVDDEDAFELAGELGYPVCIKPDSGVGASDTHKIKSEEELKSFLSDRARIPYIMEEFIDGDIVTFDGLTDADGEIVFMSTLTYDKGVLDTLDEDSDMYYYISRSIPEDLEEYGKKCVEAFRVSERFFHFEFFRNKSDNKLTALEINCRPPGGFTMDMFNYANDIDMYAEYANIVVGEPFSQEILRPYFCCYISRKNSKSYVWTREEISERYATSIVSHIDMPDIFSAVMGNYGFVLRTETEEQMHEIISAISALQEGDDEI